MKNLKEGDILKIHAKYRYEKIFFAYVVNSDTFGKAGSPITKNEHLIFLVNGYPGLAESIKNNKSCILSVTKVTSRRKKYRKMRQKFKELLTGQKMSKSEKKLTWIKDQTKSKIQWVNPML